MLNKLNNIALQHVLFLLCVSGLMIARDDNRLPDGQEFVHIHRSSFIPLRNKMFGGNQDRYRRYAVFMSPDNQPQLTLTDRVTIAYVQARCGFVVERLMELADDSAHIQYGWRDGVFVCSRSEQVVEELIRSIVQQQRQNLIGLAENVMNNVVVPKPVDTNFLIIAAERWDNADIPHYSAEEKLKIGFELYELLQKGTPGLFVVAGRRIKITVAPNGSVVSSSEIVPEALSSVEKNDQKK